MGANILTFFEHIYSCQDPQMSTERNNTSEIYIYFNAPTKPFKISTDGCDKLQSSTVISTGKCSIRSSLYRILKKEEIIFISKAFFAKKSKEVNSFPIWKKGC